MLVLLGNALLYWTGALQSIGWRVLAGIVGGFFIVASFIVSDTAVRADMLDGQAERIAQGEAFQMNKSSITTARTVLNDALTDLRTATAASGQFMSGAANGTASDLNYTLRTSGAGVQGNVDGARAAVADAQAALERAETRAQGTLSGAGQDAEPNRFGGAAAWFTGGEDGLSAFTGWLAFALTIAGAVAALFLGIQKREANDNSGGGGDTAVRNITPVARDEGSDEDGQGGDGYDATLPDEEIHRRFRVVAQAIVDGELVPHRGMVGYKRIQKVVGGDGPNAQKVAVLVNRWLDESAKARAAA